MKEKIGQRIFKEDSDYAMEEAARLNRDSTARESIATIIHKAIELYRRKGGKK